MPPPTCSARAGSTTAQPRDCRVMPGSTERVPPIVRHGHRMIDSAQQFDRGSVGRENGRTGPLAMIDPAVRARLEAPEFGKPRAAAPPGRKKGDPGSETEPGPWGGQ